jgi:hypothetical protein
MDVADHPLHPVLHSNWSENKIGRLILSCATLPKGSELETTITDFQLKFPDSTVHTVSSFDFKKTIRIVNSIGVPVLPHTLFNVSDGNYRELIECAEHCRENQTLLRYIDLASIVDYILANFKESECITLLETNFHQIEDLTMTSIKRFYLSVLIEHIDPEIHVLCPISHPLWRLSDGGGALRKINSDTATTTQPRNGGGGQITRTISVPTTTTQTQKTGCVYLTTSDAHTLTDGPTLYLAEDTVKIGRFLYQQSKIPDSVVNTIVGIIETNNKLEMRISELQKKVEDMLPNTQKGVELETKEKREMLEVIEGIRRQVRPVQITPVYIPNTAAHLERWCNDDIIESTKHQPMTANIGDGFIVRVMQLGNQVSNEIKILLMMGIGVFSEDLPIAYHEIIKELAYEQQLFIVIASDDYIYGTNYQFCHGFLGRDLGNMTPQKIIQAMGRIGRANVQQSYTVRFRNDELLRRLFLPLKGGFNHEAIMMNRLFCSS